MKRLRLAGTLFAVTACLAAQSAFAAEPVVSAPTALDFDRPCKLPPEEEKEQPSGPGIVLPRFTPQHPPRMPRFPKESRQRGEHGTVHMLVLVNEEGRASQVKLVKSTGYPVLDQIGLETAGDWEIAPGTVDGKVQCMWRVFMLNWTLMAADLPREAMLLAEEMLIVDFYRSRLVAHAQKQAAQNAAAIECFRNADLSEVRDAHAAAFAGVLTRAELKEALAFFSSPAGRRYTRSGHWHDSIASGTVATQKPPTLTDDEYALADKFLATSVGSKLIHRETLKADKLEENVEMRMRPILYKCFTSGSSQR